MLRETLKPALAGATYQSRKNAAQPGSPARVGQTARSTTPNSKE
jgi:hypothetical protein